MGDAMVAWEGNRGGAAACMVEKKELAGRRHRTECLPAMHHPNPSSRKLICDYPKFWELEEGGELAAGARKMGGRWEEVEAKLHVPLHSAQPRLAATAEGDFQWTTESQPSNLASKSAT